MKNKFCHMFFWILMCFSFLGSVHADEIEVTATVSKNTVVKGEEITIKVNVKSDKPIFNCTFGISDNDTIKYKTDSVVKNGFISTVGSTINDGFRNIFVEVGDMKGENATNGLDILEFKYIVNDSGKITIFPKECSTVEDSTHNEITNLENIEMDITATEPTTPKEDTTLKNISVTGGKLLSEFSPNTKEVMIELSSPTFGLILTASDPEYQDDIVVKDITDKVYNDLSNITWNDPTNQKMMQLHIYVNDESMYELIVRYEIEGLDNTLASLTINGENIPLEADKDKYQFTIPNNITSIEVNAVLKDSDNFQIITGTGNHTVSGDVTYVALTIEPINSTIAGESKTYEIDVIREENPSGNNNPSNSGNSSNNNGNNTNTNPGTGDISMFLMLIILISSLIGSVILYKKNLEGYR